MRYFKNVITTLKLLGEANRCIENISIFGSRIAGLNEFDSDIVSIGFEN
jgi:predicted nucleotidyltransferase